MRFRPHLIVVCALGILLLTGLPQALFHALLNVRFSLAERPASGDIAIVAIDAPALAKAGVWPWPRTLHAQMVKRLHDAGAEEIAFDVDFSSASSPEQDAAFEEALKYAGGSLALPTFKQFVASGSQKDFFTSEPLPAFAAHSWSASVNIEPDTDGVVRRYVIGQSLPSGIAPSLGAYVAGRAQIDDSTFFVDFGIRSNTIPTYSFLDVLSNAKVAAALKNKRVIIGATAVELGDRVTAPGGRIIPGVVLQALAAESLHQGRALQVTSAWLSYVFAIGLGALTVFLFGRWPATRVAFLLVGAVAASEATALSVQLISPFLIDTAPWDIAALVCAVVLAFKELALRGLLRRIAERRFQRVAMTVADGLMCTDTNGRITLWNPAAEAMFGYAADEMREAHISKVLSSDQQEFLTVLDLPVGRDAPAQELNGKRKDGSSFLVEASCSAWDAAGELNYSIAVRDISIRKREEKRIRYLAEHDTLTALLNRGRFVEVLTSRVMDAHAAGSEVGLLLIDLDRFKEINDTLGHASGDQVIRHVAMLIESVASSNAAIARLGGDEFAIMLCADEAERTAREIANQILGRFAEQNIFVFGAAQNVSCSIGAAIFPRSKNATDLMADADLAMYRAKAAGGNRLAFFEQDMRAEFERRIALTEELQQALTNREFELYYQPQIDLKSNKTVGAEALIRWNHPHRGLVSPAEFIPLLNTLAISNDVSLWIMRAACRQARQWQLEGHEIRVSINLSPAQFRSMDLPGATALLLMETGLPPRLLELEVTEDIVIEDDAAARDTFSRLNALGVHLAWDDFGTGYGSLTYLKKFPLNRLKIDQSFVRKLEEGTEDFAIVKYTIQLSKKLGLSITAEGIETREVSALLTEMGCDEGQGYLYGRPVPAADFTIIGNEATPRAVA